MASRGLPPGLTMSIGRGRALKGAAFAAGTLLLALQVALALRHVPWRDETQAWQIAAWSASWSDLLANLRYEGHPALWYCLLRLASSLSTSPAAMAAVQAIVSGAALLLLLLRVPFPVAHRLALGAGYLLLIEYGTIARSYGLGALLVLACLVWRRHAVVWLLLACMANVSLHFLLLSGALVAALAWTEERRSVPGWAVWLAGCAFAAFTVRPAPDMVPALPLSGSILERATDLLVGLGTLLVPFNPLALPAPWPAEVPASLGAVPGCAVLALAWIALRRETRLLILFLCLLGATAGVAILVYPSGLRHLGVLLLFCVAADWLTAARTGEPPVASSRGWAGISAAFGLLMAAGALLTPFTTGRAVADWARANGVADEPWTAVPAFEASLLSAELGQPVLDVGQGCLTRFTRWTATERAVPGPAELAERLSAAAAIAGRTLFVLAEPGSLPLSHPGLTRVADFASGLAGSSKIVLAVAPAGLPGPGLPACPWTKR